MLPWSPHVIAVVRSVRPGGQMTWSVSGPRGIRGQGGSDRKYDVFITTVKDKYKTEAERGNPLIKPRRLEIRGNNILHKT